MYHLFFHDFFVILDLPVNGRILKKGAFFLATYVAKKIMLPILQYYIQLLIHLQPFIPPLFI